jgi:hypothetical protein
VNVGTPPKPGASRLTLRTYRLDDGGRRVGETETATYAPGAAALPAVSLAWPPCRCPRRRTGGAW